MKGIAIASIDPSNIGIISETGGFTIGIALRVFDGEEEVLLTANSQAVTVGFGVDQETLNEEVKDISLGMCQAIFSTMTIEDLVVFVPQIA
jgi:hypothetical protein